MEKISVSRFVNEITKRNGDNADATLVITVDGDNIVASLIGIDQLSTDSSVALVAAIHAVLDKRLKDACALYNSLEKHGWFRSVSYPVAVSPDKEKNDSGDTVEKETSERELAKEFLCGLIDLIEQVTRGDGNAHGN